MRLCFLLSFLLISFISSAGTVDTVTIRSASMRKDIRAVVIKPDSYDSGRTAYPVVYLLHGFSGNYRNWISRVPALKQHADQYQLLIVCPDGAYSSWYFDSPIDSSFRYETHIALELPSYIDSRYRTVKDRRGRALTGLSMGGHGGLFLGFRHADRFSACGSMSGALAIEHITSRYDVEKRLGDTADKARYRAHSIFEQMKHYPKDSIAIIIDCGTEDYVFEMNRLAHQQMRALRIPHEYIERPGRHDWAYWANAIQYQLLFFRNHFDRSLGEK